jgi:nicotinamidase-related amidase
MYTVMENLTEDGRDRSLDYKLSKFWIAKGSWEGKVLDALKPARDDIVIPKTSSSVMNSTNIEYLLRNIGIDTLLVTGFLTDQCIDHTVRDAADRGFYPVCVTDGCATKSQERHDNALNLFKGYCRRMTTAEVLGWMGRR